MINVTSLALWLLVCFAGTGTVLSSTAAMISPDSDETTAKIVTPGGVFVVCMGAGDKGTAVVVDKKVLGVKQGPKVWIGVRLAPVPEALASHLKRGGLMIANVVEGSPADRAGVERYDVVVAFNENLIEEMSDLHAAIAESGPDKTVRMVVIRGGEKQTLEIAPVEREYPQPAKFKYDEPEAVTVDPYVKYFGHRLHSMPSGKWLIEPHGRLDALPESVKEFLNLKDIPDTDWEQWAQQWSDLSKRQWRFHGGPFGLEIEIDTDDAGPGIWFSGDLDDEDLEAEISINISEDGETIEIHRAKDGTIEVEREDADGERSSATYEGLKELRQQDAEAYKLLWQHARPRGATMMWKMPTLNKLGDMQHEFQIKVQRQIEKAREQYERALDQARDARKKVQVWKQRIDEDDDADILTRSRSVMIFIDDDGRITVEIDEGGVSKEYEFDSREDFEDSDPELYERFRKHLDDADSGARSERPPPVLAGQIA